MSGNGRANLRVAVPRLEKPQLGHFMIVVERDGKRVEHDCLVSGYTVDGAGNLHLVINGAAVASFAAGAWKEARRSDFVTEERTL